MKKVTPTVREKVDDVLTHGMHGIVYSADGFAAERSLSKIRVRIPGPGEEQREIEHIAPEELQQALSLVAEATIGLSREALIDATARALGYKRIGPRISGALEAALQRLIDADIIRMADGKVQKR